MPSSWAADGKVALKKADGKIISIPLEKLAADDQAVAKSMAEKAAQPMTTPAAPAAPNVAARDPNRIEFVTYQGITQLAKLPDTSPWRGRPDAKPCNVPALLTKPMFVPLAENEAGEFTYVDDINHHAWVMIVPQNVGPGLRFERIDLRTGERLAPTPTPHAGLVKPGERAIVTLTVVESPDHHISFILQRKAEEPPAKEPPARNSATIEPAPPIRR
jgi:hypothetical protein